MITSSHLISRRRTARNVTSLRKMCSTLGFSRSLGTATSIGRTANVLLVAAAWLVLNTAVSAQRPVVRPASDVFQRDHIDVSGARPVSRSNNSSSAQTHSPQSASGVRQVGFLSVAGCDSGGFESTCGCETICDCPVGDFCDEASCGAEVSCGIEASCGLESWIEPGCGCEGVGCDTCCDGYSPTCGCSNCCDGMGGFIDCLFPRLKIRWACFDLFAGVASHTGPMNFANLSATEFEPSGTGSFGFYEGFNKGTSLSFFGTDMAWQNGVRFTQNNLSGAGFTDETRGQVFLTSGLFRTVDYGFQYGIVLDYLYEDWYYRGDLVQLRGELGWVTCKTDVFGFKFAVGIDDDSAVTSVKDSTGAVVTNNIQFGATNQYRLFYRKRLPRCGSCEGFVGWTDNDDGLLGMDLDLPIHGNLLWNTSATYLIPNEGTQAGGNREEGWNLMIGFTYRPGGLGRGSRYSRPLLKVADNGTLMVDRR